MVNEKKGTCCHKCGHVHVKGTSCPKPYLTGAKSCARRANEGLEEMSFKSAGIGDFLKYVKANPDSLKHLGFSTLRSLVDFLQGASYQDWTELRDDLEQYKSMQEMHTANDDGPTEFHQVHADVEEGLETEHFCPQCLAEYISENWNKLEEAEYRGRKVTLGKPFSTPGGPKKRSVYVKNAKGNVVKVNFGDPNMKIKKSNPKRRKSFRARHNCENPGPRWKARYWSCKAW